MSRVDDLIRMVQEAARCGPAYLVARARHRVQLYQSTRLSDRPFESVDGGAFDQVTVRAAIDQGRIQVGDVIQPSLVPEPLADAIHRSEPSLRYGWAYPVSPTTEEAADV